MDRPPPVTERSEQTGVVCSYGRVIVSVGDKFDLDSMNRVEYPSGEYEVVDWTNRLIYSPAGIGGTRGVICRHVESGLEVEFCGDSVASAVHRKRNPNESFSNLKELARERQR